MLIERIAKVIGVVVTVLCDDGNGVNRLVNIADGNLALAKEVAHGLVLLLLGEERTLLEDTDLWVGTILPQHLGTVLVLLRHQSIHIDGVNPHLLLHGVRGIDDGQVL